MSFPAWAGKEVGPGLRPGAGAGRGALLGIGAQSPNFLLKEALGERFFS